MDTNVDAPAAADTAPGALVPIQPGLGFETSVRMWGDSAILVLETTTEEEERIAVRDAAVRVAAMAEAAGAGVSVALANEILQRAIRQIGKSSPRGRAGRPSIGGGEAPPAPVRGDKIPPAQLPSAGSRRPRATNNRSPRGTNSGERPLPAQDCLPKATRSTYRKDAEAISDEGFARAAEAVRAAAEADPAAGHKLNRATVRAAGALEAAGGDPGELQSVEAKKRALSDSRKRSSTGGDGDSSLAGGAPPRIVETARQLLGGAIDQDTDSRVTGAGTATPGVRTPFSSEVAADDSTSTHAASVDAAEGEKHLPRSKKTPSSLEADLGDAVTRVAASHIDRPGESRSPEPSFELLCKAVRVISKAVIGHLEHRADQISEEHLLGTLEKSVRDLTEKISFWRMGRIPTRPCRDPAVMKPGHGVGGGPAPRRADSAGRSLS